jgi:hypothetical protein
MIAALNQPQGEQPAAEDQSIDTTEAIAETPETALSDKGVEPEKATPDISSQLAELKKQAETADQRWRVLQGMIDKKDEEITTLRTLLAQLSSGPAQPQAAEQTPSQLITQTDITEYGTDLIDMVGRKATEVVGSRLKTVEAQLTELRGYLSGLAQTTTVSSQERFKDVLTNKVPDWETLNVDPQFISWLNYPAPFTKESKLDLLRRASREFDAAKAAEFFLAYKEETSQSAPPANSAAKFVAPGKPKAPVNRPEGTGEKRIWTRPDIARVYDDKMAGRITQAEFDKLEADIFRAQRENRIAA